MLDGSYGCCAPRREAEIKAEDAVLCVGAGTGYAVSVLAQLADSVIALESDPACCKTAGELFSGHLGFRQCRVRRGGN